MKSYILNISLAVCCLFVVLSDSVRGQTVPKPTTCEYASSYLDYVLNKASSGDTLIVIARLGRNANNISLNSRRLFNLKEYLTVYQGKSVFSNNPRNLILATASRTNGLGRLELYFKGELIETFYLPFNRDLYIGECAVDLEFFRSPCDVPSQKVFYPCRGFKTRRHH
jgi:hypothetical protein